jgi:SAM-dependent methyltransferase
MTALEKFLHDVSEIHASHAAVDETPYYGSLETLFNEIGKTLKPRVRCIIHIKNRGAGLPDGGLFTAEQFDRKSGEQQKEGQLPSRGAIEVKAPREGARGVALGKQSTRYLAHYRQVLITNLREFILVGHDLDGNPAILEKYELADSEANFWKAAAHPRKTDEVHGARFAEYLKRVMLHAAPLAAPEDVAFFLASYARDALARIEGIEIDALAAIRSALEEALGLKFEGKKGEHFFHSSLIQTLFYGVFSAWVLWARKRPPAAKERFDWNATARLLRVPVIRKLFHEVADPGQLEALNLAEVLDWTAAVLNRVDRAQFFTRFQESQAVQYFYEPFLEAFDPQLRKDLGVWYTPHEIVEYMVARVDTSLREELGLADGLADRRVYVLDPCCGTGSFLVEVLRRIQERLKARGSDALVASDLKDAAKSRVFGFEILPAPFVVSHLQLGLLLDKFGAPLADAGNERVGVYLTNALTGWEPPKGAKKQLMFPEFGEERDAAEKVKRESPVLVVLGNPPYNAFAGVSTTQEEIQSIAPYKEGLVKEWRIKKFNLDDLYVKFFRLAEHRIAEMSGRGVICYISNFSYLDDPSFVVMRKRFTEEFSKLSFDCLNGDSRETGKLTPDGKPDPSVFSTERNPEGIRVGTAIGLLVRRKDHKKKSTIQFRHFWGVTKRTDLLNSLFVPDFEAQYEQAQPDQTNRYSFRPQNVTAEFIAWPKIDDLGEFRPSLGILENRQESLISIDREPLELRMREYFNEEVDWEALRESRNGLTKDFARFDARKTREKLLRADTFSASAVRRLLVRPMDLRWCYYTSSRPLWNEPRPDYVAQMWAGNKALVSRRKGVASPEGVPFFLSSSIGFQHAMNTDAYYFPMRLKTLSGKPKDPSQGRLLTEEKGEAESETANLSQGARAYLRKLGIDGPDKDVVSGNLIWMHILAVGYSPAYLSENADGIRQDWPSAPLPNSKELLWQSAELGERIGVLLDTESPIKSVTTGDIRAELKLLAHASRVGGGPLSDNELGMTAGWGHAGSNGVTMPGQGKMTERDYTKAERDSISAGARTSGVSVEQAFTLLGLKTLDIYLNDVAYWANVPAKVWEYTIGGYQVIKKWLSYREKKLLGRPLTKDEVRYVQEMVRRIAAIILLEPALDANYKTVKTNAFPWMP